MIRKALSHDIEKLIPLVSSLWSDHQEDEYPSILQSYIENPKACAYIAFAGTLVVGIAFGSLRYDYVEGCETSPVGYLEGVYVSEDHRLQGIGRMLVMACEQWAKEQGCHEFASDCELVNTESLHFHLGIGFHEENRIICFKKKL
jgi:aminoglycoside 6'-N-acetyltransferase I